MSVLQKRLKVMLRNVPECFTRARLLYILGKEGALRLAEKIGIGPIELTKAMINDATTLKFMVITTV